MDFENSKPDFEADFSGDSDSEKAADYSGRTSSALALELQASGQAPLAQIGAQNTVVLPDGVNLDDIRVVGRDLVITLPDGSEMIIPDGAVFIPQIVIGGVTVPPLNLAALLVGNEPQPAAGPPQSSGGNFADPVGDIGDPFALGDLLPPTALSFTERENEEIFPFEPEDDAVPDVVIVTPENPAGSANATDSVDEAGLPARGAESEGSNAAGNGETTAGTIVFSAGDAPAIVSITGVSVNGVAITAVGQTVQGAFGTLTITSINNGSIGYSYTLSDNTNGDATSDFFEVSVVDADGDTATANLTINIVDDVPTAVADSDSIAAGEYGPATGNVITDAEADGGADTQGADGAVVAGVAAGDTGTALVDAGTVGTTIAGLYGVLTLNANGSYSYVRNADSAGGVQDVFTYTLQDGDGDTSVTTLTIDIADSPVTLTLPVSGEAGAVVDEEGLPARGSESPGSNEVADSETTSGTITYSAADGPAVVTINGVAVTTVGQTFAGASGTLTITGIANGAITYSYTLADNTSGDNTSDDFAISVSDQDGDNAAGTLSIAIIDDVPTAVADTDSIAAGEYGPATGNVITDAEADGGADTQGADGAVVAGVAAGDTGAVLVDAGTVGTTIAGLYGVLTLNADGSYSYARNADSPGGVQDVFTYTLQDGDGDTSVTTLTIDIADSPVTLTLPVSGEAGAVVDEEGLPARGSESPGSNAAADSETTSGTIAYDAADGPATVTINGVAVTVVGQTFVGASGVLTITGIANGAITYSYTLADNTSGDNTSDDFAVVVTDQDQDAASGTLSIAIIDDVPDAMDEATQTVDEGAVVTGSLDFVQGADGATVTQIDGVTLIFGPDGFSQSIDIGGGSIRVKADGSYEFTADDPTISPVALTTATYTVTDGDGDIDTANIGFQILDANSPVGGETLATVDDDGLVGGNPASDTGDLNANVDDLETASEAIFQGVLNFSFGGDGAGTVDLAAMNGLTGMVGQEMVTYSWDGGSNTLTATGPRGVLFTVEVTDPSTGAYTVTLLDNVLHAQGPNDENDATADLNYTVTDADGSTATGFLTVVFDDDAPTATDEASQDVNEGETVTGTLDFAQGADGATVTHIGNTMLVFGLDGFSQSIDIGDGSIRVKADGSYEFTADNPVVSPAPPTSTTFTVTDADGDTATASVNFQVVDANVPTAGTSAAEVDDDGLVGGNPASTTGDLPDANADGDGDESTFGGTLTLNFGADGPGTVDFASMDTLTAMVGQEMVTYSWDGGSNTLTATGPRGVLFTVEVTDPSTGAYTVTLLDNVLHAQGPNDENDALAALTYTVTDSDGSVANGTLNIIFDDDAPTATDEASQNVNEGATVTGTLDFVQGADGATVTHIGNTALVFGLDGFSQSVDIGDGSIKVKADGSYEFTADNPTISPVAPTTATFTVTDADGDTATANVSFQILDANVPAGGERLATVDDDGLTGGNPASTVGDLDANIDDLETASEAIFQGVLSFSFGGDGAGTVDFASMDGLTAMVGQETVTYSWLSGTLTATITGGARDGTALFTVEITNATTGAYTVTLLDNVLHAQGPNDENNALAALDYTVTDADGSTATGSLSIVFDDDAPTASDEGSQNVNEGVTVTGTLDFAAGADGGGVTHVNGAALVFSAGAGEFSDWVDIGDGMLRVKADGSYEFTADNPTISPVAPTTATFTVTDGDGDTATADVSFQILDANVPTAGISAAQVDDDGLAGGNPASTTGDQPDANADSDNDESTFGGTLTLDFGGDGAGTVDFASMDTLTAMVGQEMVTYSWDGGSNTLTATGPRGVLFTVEVTDPSTGAYTVTLVDNVLHAEGPNDENDASVSLSYNVTDADGSVAAVPGTLNITFDDDAPTASDEASQDVNEGATVTGTLDFVAGADGGGVTHVNGVALVFSAGAGEFSDWVDIGEGMLRVKADGSYEFTADDPTISPVDPTTATFTVTDGDGDTATANVSFQIVDANVPTAGTSAAEVDDDGLAGGNPLSTIGDQPDANADGDNDELTFGGTLTLDFGGDGAGTVDFASMDTLTAMVGQEMVTYSWDGGSNTLTATGPRGVLFTVEVTDPSTGAYTVTLVDNVLHAEGPNDENDASVSLSYNVTDADGSVAAVPGTLNITFDDDAPTASDEASQDVNEGATVTGTLDFVAGADGGGVTHVNGVALVFSAGAGEFSDWVDIGEGMLRVKADGSYEFTADDPTISPVDPTTATFTVTDGDGDTATANVSFQIVDANVPTAGTSAAEVDDDGLAGGNPLSTIGDQPDANADGDNDESTFGGTLTLDFGGDGAGTVDFASMDTLTAMVGQEMVTYSWDGGSNTLTATGPRGVLFTVEVTDPSTGAYTVTLVDNVLHAEGPNDENDALVSLNYNVTDADGSVAAVPGTLNITFDDDAPTLSSFSDETLPNAVGSVNGTFTYGPGADGHGSFNITGPTIDGVTNTVEQNANGALLTATVDGSGEILYTLQVNTDGTYVFSLVTPDAGSTETISLLGLGASGPDGFLEVPAGNVEFTDNGTGEGINSSTQGFGVANQFVGNGESFTMEFHDPGIVGDEPTASNPNLIDSVTLGNNNINGSLTIRWTATNSVTGETETGDIVVSGTSTLIDPTISFNHLLIEGIGGSGQGVRFSSLDITKQIIPQDLDLSFQVSAVDGDGDVTQLDDFNVFIDASLTPTLEPLAPTSITEPISFIGVESVQLFQSSDSDERLVSNDNDGLMLRNADGPVEDVALVESVAPTSSMLQNANEAQMARAAINSKAQTISQIAVAATLLAANGRPEETAGDNEVPNVELTDSVVPDVAQNQAQPEAVQLENVQIANDEGGSSVAAEASSSGGSSGSGEPPVESSIVAGEAMIVEDSPGNNDAQPGFDASEFQSASGLQLDMGIAMNMEALVPVGDAPSPEQLDVTAPPTTVEEIVADAIDGGSPEVVTIDAVIEGFAGIDTGGAHGVLEHLPAQAMPEQILDLFVQGDAGLMFSGAADPMQTQMDMVEAGHAAG